jgi:hypothetical protein
VKLTYRLLVGVGVDAGNCVASCVEVDAEGEGRTEHEAVEALRNALVEHMLRPDAVAPPPSGPRPRIDLERVI